MNTRQQISIGGSVTASTVVNAETVNLKVAGRTKRPTYYPAGCIGANLAKRNYVKYLVDRYNEFRRADVSFGRHAPFNYAVIFKNIQAEFKASAYFVPEGRFEELVDFLRGRIDRTMLGKRNAARGSRNYQTFDEYRLEQKLV